MNFARMFLDSIVSTNTDSSIDIDQVHRPLLGEDDDGDNGDPVYGVTLPIYGVRLCLTKRVSINVFLRSYGIRRLWLTWRTITSSVLNGL